MERLQTGGHKADEKAIGGEDVDEEKVSVPYIAFEGVLARAERTQRRLVIIIIITLAALFASNIAWILTLYGADYESYDIQADGASVAAYAGDDISLKGDLNNGSKNTGEKDNTDGSERQDNEEAGADR